MRSVSALFFGAGLSWILPVLMPGYQGGIVALIVWVGLTGLVFLLEKRSMAHLIWTGASVLLSCLVTAVSFLLFFAFAPFWMERLLFALLASLIILFLLAVLSAQLQRRQRQLLVASAVLAIPIVYFLLDSEALGHALNSMWGRHYNALNHIVAILITYLAVAMFLVFRSSRSTNDSLGRDLP